MSLGEWVRDRLGYGEHREPMHPLDAAELAELTRSAALGHTRAVLAGRTAGKQAAGRRWVLAMRAAGYEVVEIGRDAKGAPVHHTWRPARVWFDELSPAMPRGGGKSVILDPVFVEARRAAATDPAATFARGEFRPNLR